MSRVAILGWGSLVFHPEGDATVVQTPLATVGAWVLDGPELKVEFSRVSSGKRLTLVVDPANGLPLGRIHLGKRFLEVLVVELSLHIGLQAGHFIDAQEIDPPVWQVADAHEVIQHHVARDMELTVGNRPP